MPEEILLAIWLVAAAVPAIVATVRGRIFIFWYAIALLISPLGALAAVLIMRDLRKAGAD